MGRKHIFISGLPRAGSTLLCNILAQNPRVFVSKATSGCHDVLFGIRNQWDRLIEHQAEGVSIERLRRVMSAALDAYHDTDKEVVFDKGRGWLSLIELIEFVQGGAKAKVIVPVRDLAEVLASFELLYRKSSAATQWNIEAADYFRTQTVEGRCEIWASGHQPVGLAYNRLCDAMARGLSDRLLLVEMDELTRSPASEFARIYAFIGEPGFAHDFERVEQYTAEDDVNVHRIPGLHTIRPNVQPVPRRAKDVLGPVARKYGNLEFWR